MSFIKNLGRKPKGNHLNKIQQSPNYKGGRFENIEPTEMMLKDASYIRMILEFTHKPKLATPSRPLPCVKTDLRALSDNNPTLVWFGHSSYLIKYQGFT